MITEKELLSLNYYKKASFTGATERLRFLIRKEDSEGGEPVFHVWVWPGPYIFSKTDDARKKEATFPFTEDGRKAVAEWINQSCKDIRP